MNRTVKITIVGALVLISIGIIHSHINGVLYPGFSIGTLAAIIVFIYIFLYSNIISRRQFLVLYSVIIGIAVTIRSYIFIFPASLIGMDPDGFALAINRLIVAGNTPAIGIGFYNKAPLFFILPGQMSIITGESVRNSLIIYPVLMGIIIPLSASIFTRYVTGNNNFRYLGLAGIGGAVATTTVWFSYWPIVQILAVMYWCIFLIGLVKFSNTGSLKSYFITILMLLVSIFTHKLSLLIIVLSTFLFFMVWEVRHNIGVSNISSHRKIGVWFLLISTFALLFQQFYLTDFITALITKLVKLLWQGGIEVRPPIPDYTNAEIINPGLFGIIERQLYAFILLPVSGISWFLIALYYRDHTSVDVILAASAVSVAFIGLGVIAQALEIIPPYRGLLLAEPILMGMVAIGIIDLTRTKWPTWIPVLVMVIVLTSQVLTPVAVPDHTDSPRWYLRSNEIEAKQFGYAYVSDSIHTDFFFWHEDIRSVTRVPEFSENHYQVLNSSLYNRSIQKHEIKYVMYRNLTTYDSKGGFIKLNWNPRSFFKVEYSTVYENGETTLYTNDGPN